MEYACKPIIYTKFDFQGLKMVFANECWHRSLDTLMAKIRKELGDMPVYLTFDIDAIDSMDCPGTGKHYKTVMCMFVYLDTAMTVDSKFYVSKY